MKIDTAKIEGFDTLTAEEKVAKLLEFDLETPAPDYSGYVKKDVFDKTASDLAKLKKEQLDRLSEEEKAKALAKEEMETLRARNAELEKAALVASYKSKYLALGYSDELAAENATAFANGDMDTVFANQQKFLAEKEKSIKASMLGGTQTPPPSSGSGVITKDDILKEKDTTKRRQMMAEHLELFRSE